ncbi:hypothetical protein [Saccharothrix australiensis]|uniref:PE family protein n=1 Tax=Saccharothrix australiensis TaxID=2072 RepID=A0A495W1Y9_9PSEU|nr:hypothetical protein [Saccharothrix australiensis]RKT55672.1 hypothetical protein C8E97_4356 [Saccharothrix australiensis]
MSDIQVTLDTLNGLVDRHRVVHDELSATNQQTQVLAQVQPPIPDPATTAFTTAACQAGQGHLDSAAKVEQDLQTRIEELKASIDQYADSEQTNKERWG